VRQFRVSNRRVRARALVERQSSARNLSGHLYACWPAIFQSALIPKHAGPAPHELKLDPESFKAWSHNLGHDSCLTTFSSYGEIRPVRHGENMRNLAKPRGEAADPMPPEVLRWFNAQAKRSGRQRARDEGDGTISVAERAAPFIRVFPQAPINVRDSYTELRRDSLAGQAFCGHSSDAGRFGVSGRRAALVLPSPFAVAILARWRSSIGCVGAMLRATMARARRSTIGSFVGAAWACSENPAYAGCLRPSAEGREPRPSRFGSGNSQGGDRGLGGWLSESRSPWLHRLGGVHG
jgi:hypothetical protein